MESNGLNFVMRPKSSKTSLLPEIEVYINLLLLIYLLDNEKLSEVYYAKEVKNMFLSHFFLENNVGGRLFIFYFFK